MHEAIAAQNAIGGATAAMHPNTTIAMAPALACMFDTRAMP